MSYSSTAANTVHQEPSLSQEDPLDLVYFLDSEWDAHHRPTERFLKLAERLAISGGQLLCVNRPVCPFTTPFLHRTKWKRWLTERSHIRQLSDNVFLYTPYVLLHDRLARHVPGAPALNRRLVSRQLLTVLAKLRFSAVERVAWLSDPGMFSYIGTAGETSLVYECIDSQRDSVTGRSAQLKIQRVEERVCALADAVLCTAQALYREMLQFNPNTYLTPNAADTELLSRVQDPETPTAGYMQGLPHPVVGYLGTIHQHTDIALMKHVAEARPGWSIVMIGPQQDRSLSHSALFQSFRRLPNVYLAGWVDREELPAYCRAFDVCVIPYRTDSEFNRYVNPDKLHEYMAMGKPVVSTDIPEVRSHRHIIKIAQTPSEFVRCIEEALEEDGQALIGERMRLGRENSWAKRAQQQLDLLHRVLAEKRAGTAELTGIERNT